MRLYRTSQYHLSPERLDVYYYDPSFILHVERMRAAFPNHVRVGALFDVLDGTHDSVDTADVPTESHKIPFLRAQDIGPGYLRRFDGAFLRERDHYEKCRRSSIRRGDVLLNIMATTGEACLVTESCPDQCNANRAVGILRAKSESTTTPLKSFLCVLLSSLIGRLELARNLKGSIQQRLNLEDIARCEIPVVDSRVHSYIGEKLRQAERAREVARKVEQESQDYFLIQEWKGDRAGARRCYRIEAPILGLQRLDAPFYDPGHFLLIGLLEQRNSVSLGSVCRQIKEPWNQRDGYFYYLEIGEMDLSSGSISPKQLATNDAPSRAQRLVRPWDLLVSTVRPNRKNVCIVPVVDEELPIVASTGFSVLRFESPEAAVFYHSWLRSDAATQQLMRWNAGGAYPAIDDAVAIGTLVPPFEPDLVAAMGKRWVLKHLGYDSALRLTTAAKYLVEGLIEVKVSEAELIAAHVDPVADRTLLQRLTRSGLDVEGEPLLFPDLDSLYTVIAESADGFTTTV